MKTLIYQQGGKDRLDKFLNDQLPDLSRSRIQKLIKAGLATVNGQAVPVHHFLKTNDKIEIEVKETKTVIPAEKLPEPQIIEQTDDYLIIDKPAGLVVHPATGIVDKTLADWLKEKYPQLKNVGENDQRPGIVHRLDKEVSGVMVVALTQTMFVHLKNQFKNHSIKKQYLGLVHGKMETETGLIDFPLKRSRLSGKIVAKPKGEEGKDSLTEFEVIKNFINYAYLKINLKTGRGHQIRAHLQAYGHPLVGDKLYRNKKIKNKINLNGIFLHSHCLGFYDLNGSWREFTSPLSPDLNLIFENSFFEIL